MEKRPEFSVRKGQLDVTLNEETFKKRAEEFFHFKAALSEENFHSALDAQWKAYDDSEKWAQEEVVGGDFQNPEFRFGREWVETYHRLTEAKAIHHDRAAPTRFLVINGSPRNDQTCPGEMSKSHRLCEVAREVLEREGEVEVLDLSRLTAEYGRRIHPCKSCVATAMPLCHWPCSCYPNHALGQVQDWMNEIYEMWVRAHGILIVTPVHWYAPSSVLKLMMDRLVCADGGNPDPSTTNGKDPARAKEVELAGWKYPKHLAGRRYSLVIHGDAEGTLQVCQGISNWLADMGLESAGANALLDRYIGYYEPYATSHEALDRDRAVHEEVALAAKSLVESVERYRSELRPATPLPGLKRAQWASGSEIRGVDTDVRAK